MSRDSGLKLCKERHIQNKDIIEKIKDGKQLRKAWLFQNGGFRPKESKKGSKYSRKKEDHTFSAAICFVRKEEKQKETFKGCQAPNNGSNVDICQGVKFSLAISQWANLQYILISTTNK